MRTELIFIEMLQISLIKYVTNKNINIEGLVLNNTDIV